MGMLSYGPGTSVSEQSNFELMISTLTESSGRLCIYSSCKGGFQSSLIKIKNAWYGSFGLLCKSLLISSYALNSCEIFGISVTFCSKVHEKKTHAAAGHLSMDVRRS